MMHFYLGTHEPSWLGHADFRGVPLFVSAHRLRRRRRWRKAVINWALDSGGFMRLFEHGFWDAKPRQYAAEVATWAYNIGSLDWAAPQDWMCEDVVLASVMLHERLVEPDPAAVWSAVTAFAARRKRQPTGPELHVIRAAACLPLDPAVAAARVLVHQQRTVESVLTLRRLAPLLPFVPVLQGRATEDYLAHVRMYRDAGVDLTKEPVTGIGSVCRRQATAGAEHLMRVLSGLGVRCHGFGFKVGGLERCWRVMESADSLAWSYAARKRPTLPGCRHRTCANCRAFALRWRADLLGRLA